MAHFLLHSYLSPHGMYFHEREYIFQTMFNFFPADLLASIDIPRCPFSTRATLLSFLPLFSDRLVSSLQIRRRPVRFLPLTPVYLYAFMPMTCLLSFLRRRSIPATFFPA